MAVVVQRPHEHDEARDERLRGAHLVDKPLLDKEPSRPDAVVRQGGRSTSPRPLHLLRPPPPTYLPGPASASVGSTLAPMSRGNHALTPHSTISHLYQQIRTWSWHPSSCSHAVARFCCRETTYPCKLHSHVHTHSSEIFATKYSASASGSFRQEAKTSRRHKSMWQSAKSTCLCTRCSPTTSV
jgi:hypothetical protein